MFGNFVTHNEKDYSKWERSTRTKPLLWATFHHKAVISSNKGEIIPSPTGKSGKSQNAVQNDFTTRPKLSTRRAPVKVEQDQITSKRKDNIKALMLLITSRKNAIKDLEEHCEQLQERNLQMARSIIDTDGSSVSRAKKLLTQREQMRKSVVALKKWDDSLIKSANAELTDTEEVSQTNLSGLQKQLDMVKAELGKARKELRFLKTYKDMEFPVKALQIADMKRKLDKLKVMQQKEQEDVNLLFEKETVHFKRCQHQREQEVLSAVVEKHESHVPPIVKLVASQNYTMREEINMHRKVIMELEQRNEELMKSIRELQLSRPNIRRVLDPIDFQYMDKNSSPEYLPWVCNDMRVYSRYGRPSQYTPRGFTPRVALC